MISASKNSNETEAERASDMSEIKISRGSPFNHGLSFRFFPRRSDQPAASLIRPGNSVSCSNDGA